MIDVHPGKSGRSLVLPSVGGLGLGFCEQVEGFMLFALGADNHVGQTRIFECTGEGDERVGAVHEQTWDVNLILRRSSFCLAAASQPGFW